MNWIKYDWFDLKSRPPKSGRYLIYRAKCDKLHFEQWNGSGWASSNNSCTHWCEVQRPKMIENLIQYCTTKNQLDKFKKHLFNLKNGNEKRLHKKIIKALIESHESEIEILERDIEIYEKTKK